MKRKGKKHEVQPEGRHVMGNMVKTEKKNEAY